MSTRVPQRLVSLMSAVDVSNRACCDEARAAVVHGHNAVAERLRREQLELARAGQPALVQRRAVTGDPGMDEQLVLVDQVRVSGRVSGPEAARLGRQS
jgi:hypothetical protein